MHIVMKRVTKTRVQSPQIKETQNCDVCEGGEVPLIDHAL